MLILQMNEINFDIVQKYIEKGMLPEFKTLLTSDYKVFETQSEPVYEHLEPWIQWVSFYTGQSFEEHQVFHLGDYKSVAKNDLFYKASQRGHKVGLFCSMNHCGFEGADIYIPDPWSTLECDDSYVSKCTQKVVSFLVNRNAEMASPLSVLWPLLVMFFTTKGFKKYSVIFRAVLAFLKHDRALLSGYFDFFILLNAITRHKKSGLDLSAVFLNGVAHVQHHYMINASVIGGKNPEWYMPSHKDPLLDALKIYDEILGVMRAKKMVFSVITGLSQEPYKEPELYWRFKDHGALFAHYLDGDFTVVPRMTRDFHLDFKSRTEAKKAFAILGDASVESEDGTQAAFGHMTLSDTELFASFVYSGQDANASLVMNGKSRSLHSEMTFVAIKNAGHISKGWALLPRGMDSLGLEKEPKIWALGDAFRSHLKI